MIRTVDPSATGARQGMGERGGLHKKQCPRDTKSFKDWNKKRTNNPAVKKEGTLRRTIPQPCENRRRSRHLSRHAHKVMAPIHLSGSENPFDIAFLTVSCLRVVVAVVVHNADAAGGEYRQTCQHLVYSVSRFSSMALLGLGTFLFFTSPFPLL